MTDKNSKQIRGCKNERSGGSSSENLTARRGRGRIWRLVAQLGGIALVVCLVWAYSYDRLSPQKWSLPVIYQGDSLEVMAFIKAAAEFDYIPCLSQNISRLGAPFKANWDDNPMYKPFVTFFMS